MKKVELKQVIKSDLFRYFGTYDKKKFVKGLLMVPGFRFTYIFRWCQFHYNNKNQIKYLIYKLLLIRYRYKYGYEIPYKTQIGKGFCITHFGGIAINPMSIIGDNVNISKGITIGVTYRGEKEGAPIIGNEVWIGSNATIVGKITVGDNVLIAPGSYVNFNIPSNSIVLGNPAIVKYNENATKGYINNLLKT